MLRTGGLACVRSTRFLVGPSRLSAAHPLALLTSSRTSQRPGWGAAGSSRGLCAAPEVSPKIQALVDQISELTLLEASELTDALKEKLGISGAMMMPAGGGGPAPAAAAAEQEEAAPEKLIFTIKLAKFDAATKIKLIKEVRAITGLGLKEAKELVEKAPSDVKADVKKEEAEEIKKKLEEVGGTVELL